MRTKTSDKMSVNIDHVYYAGDRYLHELKTHANKSRQAYFHIGNLSLGL